MRFSDLQLHSIILKNLDTAGYAEPTAVQARSIPAALEGRDLVVSAQTGSGKTAAFLLPSLQRLLTHSSGRGIGPRVLVLTPTRELAAQIERSAEIYGRGFRRLRTACVVGGTPYGPQIRRLSQRVDLVVATPGRLLDHMKAGRIDFSRLETLVLDEADRMLDMGFVEDIERIVSQTPESRQTLLFSATLDGIVGDLARRFTRSPERIEIAAPHREKALIDQRLLYADSTGHKARLLNVLLRADDLRQAVVFTATKRAAEEISATLREQGFDAAPLHGDMQQNLRSRTLHRLRQGQTRILVATDVAARGIDVAGISHVINYDPPRRAEDYVHRIGRTGRAGRTGKAITLAGHHENRIIRGIERFTGQSIPVATMPGLEPSARPPRRPGPRPDEMRKRRGNGGRYRPRSPRPPRA